MSRKRVRDIPASAATPRVLHLMVRRGGGGTERNIRRLSETVPGFRFFALEDSMDFPLNWRRLYKTRALLRRQHWDAVFCYGLSSHLAAMAIWPLRMPLVGNMRCESDFEGRKGTIRRAIRWRFSGWVSNSRRALNGEPGTVIYNGIPPAPPAEQEPPLLTDLPRPVLGVLARGHGKKGHDFALAAWKDAGKPGTLVFAGELPAPLKNTAESEGVVCTGHVGAGPLLRSLDLLLIPSSAEGVPTVLLEALIRGIPVLSTPVGGVEEVVENDKECYIRQRPDWVAFLKNLNLEEAQRLAEAGRERVLADYSMERMTTRFRQAALHFARRRKAASTE